MTHYNDTTNAKALRSMGTIVLAFFATLIICLGIIALAGCGAARTPKTVTVNGTSRPNINCKRVGTATSGSAAPEQRVYVYDCPVTQ